MEKIIEFILNCVVNLTAWIFSGLLELIRSFTIHERKTALDASFNENPGEIISKSNKGYTANGESNISIENSFRNQISYGGAGAGKTSNILIPNILHSLEYCNAIINDPSFEVAEKISGVAHQVSMVLYYDAARPERSEKFNPLKRIKKISDAMKLATLLIINVLGKTEAFWENSAINVLTIIIRLVVFHMAEEVRTMQNVLYLIDNMMVGDKVDLLFARVENDDALVSAYKSFIAMDSKLANSVLATVKAALGLFTSETVIQVTSGDTLDLSSFKRDKICLIINNNINNTKFYAPLTAILLHQLFDELMRELPKPDDRPVFLHIDEAASIHMGGSFPIIVANCRKYQFSFSLIYQSYHQLSAQYGAELAKAVEANCWMRVFLPGTPSDISATLEREMGVFDFIDEITGMKRTRALMTSSEIRETSSVLVFCGHHRVLKLPLKPYYLQPKLLKLTSIPPYEPEPKPSIEPSLIKL